MTGLLPKSITQSGERDMHNTDLEEIARIVGTYYDAMYHGDGKRLREVFDADATFYGIRDCQCIRRTLDDFVELVRQPYDGPPDYGWDIALIDVCGAVGIVKLTDTYRGRSYTDYLTLSKGRGEWKIVNKAFLAMN